MGGEMSPNGIKEVVLEGDWKGQLVLWNFHLYGGHPIETQRWDVSSCALKKKQTAWELLSRGDQYSRAGREPFDKAD